jgi:G protein beta subunit-like protein
VLISPDVQQLATASSDKTVKLWNVDGFSLDRTLTGVLLALGAASE